MNARTAVIVGASRGIGAEMARRLALFGWNVVIIGKTLEPNQKVSGTLNTVAKEIRSFGGSVLVVQADVRSEDQMRHAMEEAAFFGEGKIDALINNASAVIIKSTEELSVKEYDLMQQIIVRGTFLSTKICLPYLKVSSNPHVLSIAPPLPMEDFWLQECGAYAMAKREVSTFMDVMAKKSTKVGVGIAFNTLWPKYMIYTAATIHLFGEPTARKCTRNPKIMADAASLILDTNSKECNGQFFLDEDVVRNLGGIHDLSVYLKEGSKEKDLRLDVFV